MARIVPIEKANTYGVKRMSLFRRIKKAESDALTEMFHRYLEFLFQTQLQKRMKTLWMRKGDLDEPLPDDPFRTETLRSILKNQHTVPEGMPNFFILQGDMGDGRRFYLKKMLEVCYEEIHHIGWEQAQKQDVEFRFPILAVQEVVDWAESESSPLSLVDFALRCMIQQLELKGKERGVAQTLLEKLGKIGKLAVFFNEKMCDDTNALINRLTVPKRQAYRPIAVFIESSQFPSKRSGKYYCIRIQPLKIPQIIRYLCAELPGHYCAREAEKMLQEQAEVVDILSKPERLLLHISAVRRDPALKDSTNITITKIYESFLSAQVNQAYNIQSSQDNKTVSEAQLTEWLICRAKAKEFPDDPVGEQCERCFADTEMFNETLTNFRFEGCKYYLIAQSYFTHSNSWNNIRKRIRYILLNEHPMVLKFFADICVVKNSHPETFFKQLVALMNDPNENEVRAVCDAPAKLLADILTFTGRVGRDGVEFVKWAGKEMWKDVYDTSVLEVLSSLNKQNGAIASQLEDQYTKTKNAREKRRIAYCFGYLGPGQLSEQMIQDFCKICAAKMDDETRHLQYHISTALIDCCQRSEDLYSFFGQLEDVLGNHVDPILRSDFDTLYTQINNSRYQATREEQRRCEDELIWLLEHGKYYQMAHAAGALGRRNYDHGDWGLRSVIDRLLAVLDKILSDMSQVQTVESDALKAVSYIVESCCKLAERNHCYTEVGIGLRQRLESHLDVLLRIDVPILVYQCMEVALKLMATGLIWLVDPILEVRAELGLCFSSNTTILHVLSDLTERDRGTDEVGLKEKIQALEELFDTTKVEEKLRCKFQHQSECGRELDFSLAYLMHEEKPIMAGFLFCYQGDIYFITCRHCFFKEGAETELRIPLEELDQVVFSLACLDDKEQYHGTMRYPKNVSEPASFEGSAADDLVIYQLTDVPMWLTQVVFSKERVLTGADGIEGRLKAFSFPEWSRIPGRFIYGSSYNVASRGFFFLTADPQQPLGGDADWFSGVPIIKENDGIWIVGMWKASDNEDQKIFGSTMSAILSELDKITKERMYDT